MTVARDQRLLRLSATYMLDQLATARPIFDIVDSLITVAVSQASVAPVSASTELQVRYATYDQPPPDHLRRPISINALSQSLRLPFETVRRRLIKLSLLGACRSTAGGFVVPSGALFAPIHKHHLERNDRLTADLWEQVADQLQRQSPRRDDTPVWDKPPLRIVSRVSLNYVLRLADQLGAYLGDPVSVVVIAALIEADGAPMTRHAIANRVQMPAETLRRRAHNLAGRDLVLIGPSGVVAAPEFLTSEPLRRIAARNRSDLARLFMVLGDLGVVDDWRGRARHEAA